MLRHSSFPLLVVVAITSWGITQPQDTADPEGTQDGPCPDVASTCGDLDWSRLIGPWNEILRMPSFVQPNQCPVVNDYSGTPPNITVTLRPTLPDGTVIEIPRFGVIQENTRQRLFDNPDPNPSFPDPTGLLFETIYTDYRNVHVFWTCHELEGNKNIYYVWIESRADSIPQRILDGVFRKLESNGIDTSRFWRAGADLCA